jgi:hypothetical protein
MPTGAEGPSISSAASPLQTTPLQWSYLFSSEPSLPRKHFAAAADAPRLEAYDAAIKRAVASRKIAGALSR